MKETAMSAAALVGSFDDIVRSAAILSEGIEGEFLKFVLQQEDCRKKWLETENSCVKLKQEITKLKAENEALDVKLKHARNQIEIEIKKRMKAEAAQDHLDRQVALIRELLTDKETMSRLNENERQTLMQSIQVSQMHNDDQRSPRKRPYYGIDESSASILSPSDISYDTTADDLDEPAPQKNVHTYLKSGGTPPKKLKTSIDHVIQDNVVAGTKVTVSPDGPIKVSAFVNTLPSPNRPTIRPEDINDVGLPKSNLYPALPVSRTPSTRETPKSTNSIKTGKRKKSHIFCSKTVIKPESCQPCGKRIKFGKLAFKCKDCRAVCHPDCKDAVPLPCIPSNFTPGSGQKRPEETIDFYAPSTSPMIPNIVIECVQEIEKRGLTEVGLYRVPGAERTVKEIKEKLLHGKMRKLHDESVDIHVICGVLKDFFRNLAEPIITYQLWQSFTSAAASQDDIDSSSALYQAVSELPQANRDTLAFLVTHLQRVSQCHECKMTVQNLSKVFGPTLVGHSTPNIEPIDMLREVKLQPPVLEKLLAMPVDYWNQFLNVDENLRSPPYNPNTHRSDGTPLTPECRPVPQSMLGPISATPGKGSVKKKGSFLSRTPLTPRFGSKSKVPNKRPTHFFASPMLK
ncbi:rac GTPase-activating protein 1-like isoform X2 [Actinia tenebrosa]|uniref:Rac GTPase-activating protein 1-like isoform X2 n=1 Tax=Actinia tenebrosa TaxID=6105 RepID=A0A6P8H4J3_ACTTE|nr:rac GTPase-activating protein 1-like isoform X2 [Actinia tenebrosa]